MPEPTDRRVEDKWSFDKRIPIAYIVVALVQTFTIGWWASSVETRLNNTDVWQGRQATVLERLAVIEDRIKSLDNKVIYRGR